jgi:hypothetical protein
MDVTQITGIKRHQTGILNFNSMFLEVNLIISHKYFEWRFIVLLIVLHNIIDSIKVFEKN